jgi:uncharacterized protein (DUF2336 family)
VVDTGDNHADEEFAAAMDEIEERLAEREA